MKTRLLFSIETRDRWILETYKGLFEALKDNNDFEVFCTAYDTQDGDEEYNIIDYQKLTSDTLSSLSQHWPGEVPKDIIERAEQLSAWTPVKKMIQKYYLFKSVFNLIQPDAVIVWNGMVDIRGMVRHLLCELNAAFFYAEKGMLPKSWYIDEKGLNAESSISPDCYRKHLSQHERKEIQDYIKSITNSGSSAWDQPGRLGGDKQIKKQLGLDPEAPVIFFPGQVDGDVNIKKFSPFESVAEAAQLVQRSMPQDFTLIIKPHPKSNEISKRKIIETANQHPNTLLVKNANIWDLIEVSDMIVTINSTVAFESLLQKKKVLLLGDSLLSRAGLLEKVPQTDLKEKINEYLNLPFEQITNYVQVLSFVGFLRDKFYIFKDSLTIPASILNRINNRIERPSRKKLTQEELLKMLCGKEPVAHGANHKVQINKKSETADDAGQPPETTKTAASEISPDNREAIDLFLKARDEFESGRFATAEMYMLRYRQLMDYSKLPRLIDTSQTKDNIDISVIIVTYNRNEELIKCFQCLTKQRGTGFEIIVVDNGRSNSEQITRYADQYIDCPVNFNLSEGRNIGAHFARGRIVVFLDDDALVDSDYISSIRSAFDKYDIAGLRGRAFPKTEQSGEDEMKIYDLGEKPFPTYCNQEGNSAFSLEIYKSLGGMDPLLFGHEGSDLTYRIITATGQVNKVIYWPDTIIYHDRASGEALKKKRLIHQRSANYLRYKHNDNIFINRWQISGHPLPVKDAVENQTDTIESHSKKPDGYPRQEIQHKFEASAKAECSKNQKTPKLSVIISCYNCEKFLAECIESVQEQTLQDWELFLLDDGSEDRTRQLIQKYAQSDERIKPYYFDDNTGPYIRRNFAIEQANADFIVIQDADDIMSPDKLKLLYREINKDEKLGVVGSFYRVFLEELSSVEYAEDLILPVTHQEIMERYRTVRYVCWHGSAVIRKTLFEKIGPYDENPFGSDKLWLSKAAELAGFTNKIKFKNIPEFLTLKREHPLSQQGRLPPLDRRSRRTKFQNYWETKFENIREKVRTNLKADITKELRNCVCSDYIERFGHQFEQWENEPLDKVIFYTYLDRSVAQLAEGMYVSCIITLDSLSRMVQGVERMFSCYDLLRGLAYFGIAMDQRCKYYLEQEFANHSTDSALDFVKKYLGPNTPDFGASRRREIIANTIFPFGIDSKDEITDNNIIKDMSTYGEQKPVKLSIVINVTPAVHRDQQLSGLLHALDQQSDHSFEVVIIQSSEQDHTFNPKQITERLHYRITFIEIGKGLGHTRAKNIAARLSNGLYLAFLPGDISVRDDFAANIIKRFENNHISGLRGKTINRAGQYLSEYYNPGDETTCAVFDIEEFLAIRKDVLMRLGGLNEKLPNTQALGLSYKIYLDEQVGTGPILYCPELTVYADFEKYNTTATNSFIAQSLYFLFVRDYQGNNTSSFSGHLQFIKSLYPSRKQEIHNYTRWAQKNAMFFESRSPELAQVWAQKAYDIQPDSLKIMYTLGSSYLKQGMYKEAWELFERIIPRVSELLKSEKQSFLSTEFDSAEQAAQFLLSSSTKAAQCLMKLRKYKQLKDVYENLLRTPRVKIPQSQAAQIAKVLQKLQAVEKQSPAFPQGVHRTAQARPEVSVIMPAYNAADYIGQAIQSVLKQTHSDLELVVVNDGSTDNTEQIVQSLKDKRIKYFSRQNQGLASSYNTAIKHSQGRFIIRLDADDMISPDFIERHLLEFEKHPDADLVYCDDLLIDENAKPIRIIKRPEYKNHKLLTRDLFRNGYPVVPFRGCIQKSVFDKIGFFDEQLLVAEDYDMMRRFVKKGLKMRHLGDTLYLRRMTPDSLSRKTSSQKADSHFEVLRRFTETFSYEELFPEIDWDKIPRELRHPHFRSMVAQAYLVIGKAYVQSNAPALTETACRYASSELKQCLQMEPGNEQLKGLFEKCELAGRRYQTTEAVN